MLRMLLRDVGVMVMIIVMFIIAYRLVNYAAIEASKDEDYIVAEMEITNKDTKTNYISTGKTIMTTTTHYLYFDIGDVSYNLKVSSALYDSLEVHDSILVKLYYDENTNEIKNIALCEGEDLLEKTTETK